MIPQPPGAGLPPPPEPPPARPAAAQKFRQITLSEREMNRLGSHIWDRFIAAQSNHDRRMSKFRRFYRLWRGLEQSVRQPGQPANFEVPLLKWFTFGQWAKIMAALLGEDAEITAEPDAPDDQANAQKVSQYMTWRVFKYMRATVQFTIWVFYAVLFGRAHAKIEYVQEFYWERRQHGDDGTDTDKLDSDGVDWLANPDGSIDVEVLAYDGPRLRGLWPSEFVVPAQDNCIDPDDFDWCLERVRFTPQQLLDGEAKGKFQGIKAKWREIVSFSQQAQERKMWWDNEKMDADEAEGVDHFSVLGNRDSLEGWLWYGKWRLPKGKRDSVPDNLDYRQTRQTELLVTYLPDLRQIIGVQDLRDLYPRMKKRRPFLGLSLVKDGSYWSPGFGELLEEIQSETTINYALFRKAGMLSVGPIIFFDPASGFDPDTFEYRPGTAIPSNNPAGVKAISLQADLTYCLQNNQALKGMGELLTSVSDQTLGQAIDRPNAPRTLGGQQLLIQEGNVRASLDMNMLREDLAAAIRYIWELDAEYADDEVFFRVTGEDSANLFDTNNGFGTMTAEERETSFSFDVKFATSVYSREAKKQAMLQLYTISMQNPIVATNPRGLWVMLNRVWEAFGEKNFRDIIPEPPETDTPKSPKIEWQEMLKGEVIEPNPLDDDITHLIDHRRRLEQEVNKQPARQDSQLMHMAMAHIIAHEQQRRQKLLLQEIATRAVEHLQRMGIGQATPPNVQGSGNIPAGNIPGPEVTGLPGAPAQLPAMPGAAATIAANGAGGGSGGQ